MNVRRGDVNFDFIGKMRFFLVASTAAVVLSIVALVAMGLNFGIDFAGGYEIQVKFPHVVSETEIRQALSGIDAGDGRVQRFGATEDNEYLILVREHGTIGDTVKDALRADFEALAGGADNLTNWAVAESGERLTLRFAKPTTEDQVRDVVGKHGLHVKSITTGERDDRPEFSVELVSLADRIEEALRRGLKIDREAELVGRVEFVGPQVGAQLRNQGILAVIYALAFILLYIAVRFDLFFAPGAVVALVHDVLITVGVFAVFQLEFNLSIVAAVLALIGYSLNDTIVVYDRIRENGVRLRGRPLRALVNTSINQTLSRTMLTSGTTLLVVVMLLVFGGGIIRDFSIALFVGVMVGTYSSVAVASPLYILLRERYQKSTSPKGKQVVAA